MKFIKLTMVSFFLLFLVGCAVGNRYDYRQANISLPVTGNEILGAGVIDMRSYVLNKDKTPDFIGLQRGGYGNPFDVKTASGKALADDMSEAMSGALSKAGYTVNQLYFSSPDSAVIADVISKEGKEKNVILLVKEWKTDVYANITLSYDLLLQIMDKQSHIIASNSSDGKVKLTGAGISASSNSQAAAAAFETKIGRLFNHPEIIAALNN